MVLRTGTKVRVRLRQDPEQVYNGVVQAIFTPRGRRLEELDLRGPVAKRTQVHCRVEFHEGLRICVLGGKADGTWHRSDELWSFDPEPEVKERARALVEAVKADPSRYAEALTLFRERVEELQGIAAQYGDTERAARYEGDPEAVAADHLKQLLVPEAAAPEVSVESPEPAAGAS